MDPGAAAAPRPGAHARAFTLDAVILAGGRSSRLGGTPKAELEVGGIRLVDLAVAAALEAGAGRTVVAGPPGLVAPPAISRREDPPFGGPVAGVAAALEALPDAEPHGGADAAWVLVLSCDLPHAHAVAAALADAARTATDSPTGDGIDGICLDDGRPQWLTAVYRRARLDGALARLGTVRDASVGALVGGLRLDRIDDVDGLAADVDTWADLRRAREASARPAGAPNRNPEGSR
ncbi:molybdenum cofactor guanylyltransferase [Agromyces sp. NPDC056965]|uniref:molybdenum cofactor guanylyltransferase n=1 Tax=Agromyces sp. NPDC056965 TaxID=3345983 RepID=UPI003625D360